MTEPARWGRRRRVLDALDRAHLARPAVRAYETALALKSTLGETDARPEDGLPLPPARMRTQIGPLHAYARFFFESGRHNAEAVRSLLADNGTDVERCGALLDWGCGCGRVLRHWSRLRETKVHGCDITPKMVAWCRENLPFAHVKVNELAPPLPYPDESFGLVYAFSVMTHLSEELQHAWVAECRRILRPGGFFLFSTLGEYYASRDRLTPDERRSFDAGNLVVLYARSAGSSLCSAYHPQAYVERELARGLHAVGFRPASDDGRHDLHLLRKPNGQQPR